MQQLLDVVNTLCVDIATPVAELVRAHLAAGEWVQLQKLKISPSDYDDALSYWKDAVVVDLLRKCQLPSGVDLKAAAVKTFFACESENCKTNLRLKPYLPDHFLMEDHRDIAVAEFISDWRKEVANVLKSLPRDLSMRFGKGSTYGDKGSLITIPDKMSGQPTITGSAMALRPFWEETLWYKSLRDHSPRLSEPELVRGNRFSSVPKTGLTDRGICIEPSLNLSFQLDVGRLLKTKLRTIGIDLKEGQETHRDRAQASSLLDTDATVDLSNASDTICRTLVQLVLPESWWLLLNSLRSPTTVVNGKVYYLEKFSSMGNGFTFELETVIFATLARLIVSKEGGDPDRVSCYGDDIIVPKRHVASLLSALTFFGFQANKSKTFTEGPFRESCGGDYFRGIPVRAHFLEELPYEPQHWISLANGLRRTGLSDPNNPSRYNFVRRARELCLRYLPSHIRRLKGPESLGDVVIHDAPEHWQTSSIRGVRCVRGLIPTPVVLKWDHWRPSVQLTAATLGLPSRGVSPRGEISGWKLKYLPLYGTDFLPRPMDYATDS